MKHAEDKSNRELVEAMIARSFFRGLIYGALAGSGLAGIGMAAAAAFWMLT